jgi:hypothetical protein
MKQHILSGMQEQFDNWEALLAELGDEQINTPLAPSFWSVKIVIAHLYAWQQITNARVAAADSNSEPVFPNWPERLDPDSEGNVDRVNAWVYETYRDQPWEEVHLFWREGTSACSKPRIRFQKSTCSNLAYIPGWVITRWFSFSWHLITITRNTLSKQRPGYRNK